MTAQGYTHKMKNWNTPTLPSTDVLWHPFFWPNLVTIPPLGNKATGFLVTQSKCEASNRNYMRCELAQSKLLAPMKVGEKYTIQYDISGDDLPYVVSKHIGIYLTESEWQDSSECPIISHINPQINLTKPLKFPWQRITTSFKADKPYRYLTLGFWPESKIYGDRMYFAMDNISVTLSTDPSSFELSPEEELAIENLQFEVNSVEIKTSSFADLKKLAKWAMENPEYVFLLTGHTDSDGTAESNLRLSKERAIAVQSFLINAGVPKYQLKNQGFGESMPLVENNTVKNKKRNRRVMIKIDQVLNFKARYPAVLEAVSAEDYSSAFEMIREIKTYDQLPIAILLDEQLAPLKKNKTQWLTEIINPIKANIKSEGITSVDLFLQIKITELKMKRQKLGEVEFWEEIKTVAKTEEIKTLPKPYHLRLDQLIPNNQKLPTLKAIGNKGIESMLKVVYFSNDLVFQEKWKQRFTEASAYESEYKFAFAYITDKMLMDKNEPQIYGTQMKDGQLYQISDTLEVRENRRKIGLFRMF